MPHDRDEITVALDGGLQDSEAVVGVVKCYSFDASDEFFRDTIHAGIITLFWSVRCGYSGRVSRWRRHGGSIRPRD